jgi:hypothetical protein
LLFPEAMTPLPEISAADCFRVLQRCGFDVRCSSSRFWLVERGGVAVVFPAREKLAGAVLGELLTTLCVDAEDFLATLSDIRGCEAPTLRAIPVQR